MNELVLALIGSLALAAFQAIAPVVDHLSARYRATVVSMGGGTGLAYVFLYLLFELAT